MGEEQKNLNNASAGETQVQQDPEVKEQTSVETGEQAPQFWLDEEGNLHGVFDDWGISEEEQKEPGGKEVSTETTETTTEEKTEPQASQYYTPEELAKLELDQLEPARIPPELRPYYEALLKAEAEKKTIQEEKESQLGDEKQVYDFIQAEARKRVEAKLGEPFNELNPKHITALAVEAAQLTQEVQKKMIVQQKINELQRQEPYFKQIVDYMKVKVDELPAKEYKNLMNAIQNDDFDTFYKFFEQYRKEFYKEKLGKSLEGQNQPQAQTQPKPSSEPPKVEKAGKGEVATEPAIKPQDFAYMNEDEQVEALVKLGLV